MAKKKGGKGPAQIPLTGKGQNPWISGPTPVARGGCGGAPRGCVSGGGLGGLVSAV